VIYALLGAVLALPYAFLSLRQAQPERWLGVGLLLAALVYVLAAFTRWDSQYWLMLDGSLFLLMAFLVRKAWRGSLLWLAAGWLIHAAWDHFIHGHPLSAAISPVPAWYPPLCLGFDMVCAGAALYAWSKQRGALASA
jgi:hypothetical protein